MSLIPPYSQLIAVQLNHLQPLEHSATFLPPFISSVNHLEKPFSMASGYGTPVWYPFQPLAYNDSEDMFNWEIKSEHMPEIYIGNTHSLEPWRMELRFMLVDIERQLRGSGGIKEWSSYYVPDLVGPQIKSVGDGWVRTFTFSEYVENDYGTRLTGDWLVAAKVWSNNCESLYNFDVRRNAGVSTRYRYDDPPIHPIITTL